MKRLAMMLALAVTLIFTTGFAAPTPAFAAASSINIPVTGSSPSGAAFAGSFNLQKFAVKNGQVVAIGTLTGTVTNALGQIVGSIVNNITLPVTVGNTSCDILHLELGPLSLNLLGLQIDLNQVVLDITAQSGAGNLLGNLLCAVAGLLNSPSQLANLLNQILALL